MEQRITTHNVTVMRCRYDHKCSSARRSIFLLAFPFLYRLLRPFNLVPRIASITISAGVELIFNCVWLLLGASLITTWAVGASRSGGRGHDHVLPSRQHQFTALLLLVILLFPVISLTDDLARCTAPREAERALRLHDLFDGPQPTPALLPSTLAWMDTVARMLRAESQHPEDHEAHVTTWLEGLPRSVDSRPPPLAL